MNKILFFTILSFLIILVFVIPYLIIEYPVYEINFEITLLDILYDLFIYGIIDEFNNKCYYNDIGCNVQKSTLKYNFLSCGIIESMFVYVYDTNERAELLMVTPAFEMNNVYWVKCIPNHIFNYINKPGYDQYCLNIYDIKTFCAELPAVETWYIMNKHRCQDKPCYIINDHNQYYKDLSSNNNRYSSYYGSEFTTCYFDNDNIPKRLPITIQVDMPYHTPKWQDDIQLTITNVSINNMDKHEFHIYDKWNNRFNISFEPNIFDRYEIKIPFKEHNIQLQTKDDITGHGVPTLELHVTYNNQCGVGLSYIID